MPETRQSAFRNAAHRLESASVETPVRDARDLLLWVENIDNTALISQPEHPLDNPGDFEAAIARRMAREPVSKIIGARRFWKHTFIVTPDVLDPRPDTETLVAAALEAAADYEAPRILDLGTGTGCILLSLLADLPGATGLGTDASDKALAVAKRNAEALNLCSRAKFLRSDWFEKLDGTFDLVVCNPPYIAETEKAELSPEVSRWDPEAALFGGMDGLQAYRRILSGLPAVIRKSGMAFLEIGAGQSASVRELCREAGFEDISSQKDLGGHERCMILRQ